MKRFFKYLLPVFLAAVLVNSCEEEPPVDDTVKVMGVTLDRIALELTSGDSFPLIATITPSNATNQELAWACNDSRVVKVEQSEDGKATVIAVGEGYATVAVTTVDGNFTEICLVTVIKKDVPVTGVTLEPDNVTITEIGGKVQLKHTIIPADATNPAVQFTSDNPLVATVDRNTGLVTAVGKGMTTIAVTTSDGGHIAICNVTVAIPVTGISLDIKEAALNDGEKLKLTLTIEPANATVDKVIWASTDEKVATVDQNGNVTATGLGKAAITVTVNDEFTATCHLTVSLDIKVRKEFRAAWISTAWSIDWPPSTSESSQKQRFIQYLDMFQAANMNAIFVQVRGRADPFWESKYESWSGMLSGTSGQAPSYDVMQFMIEESHKRGIEFHAWLNPFRIATTGTDYEYPALDPKIPNDLVRDYSRIRMYNPALPEVHQRLADIVEELIAKYPDIDGIHMDDYFYPASSQRPEGLGDQAEYAKYGAGYRTINEWRFANVDKVIQNIQQVILRVNPRVVFSISPQANEANNDGLYADIYKWCQQKWIDLVIPQIYQPVSVALTSPPNRPEFTFTTFLNTWVNKYAPIIPTIVGLPLYRILDANEGNFPITEWEQMLTLLKSKPIMQGEVIFTAHDFTENRGGSSDKLKSYYANPAVRPAIGRKTEPEPVVPDNVALTGATLSWTQPSEGLTSVVYLIPEGGKLGNAFVVAITKQNSITVTQKGEYLVTTFNRNNVESLPAKGVIFN